MTQADWIDGLVEDWRATMAAAYAMQAVAGEIPCAQVQILADIAASQLKALLLNGENTRLSIAEIVFREHFPDADSR